MTENLSDDLERDKGHGARGIGSGGEVPAEPKIVTSSAFGSNERPKDDTMTQKHERILLDLLSFLISVLYQVQANLDFALYSKVCW